jgi:hypothetical protein
MNNTPLRKPHHPAAAAASWTLVGLLGTVLASGALYIIVRIWTAILGLLG